MHVPAPARTVILVGLALGLLLAPPAPAWGEEGEAKAPLPGPRLVFDRTEHDFGPVAQEQEVETTFTYRNSGDAPVEGIRPVGDCGCYGVAVTKERLEPGETGELSVKFRTLMFSGRVRKRLKIFTKSDPTQPSTLRLYADVVAGVILDPGRIWFGDVLVGKLPSKTVVAKWSAKAGRPFEVTSVEVPGHEFAITKKPYARGEWKGEAITFTFTKPPPLGIFSATALIRTNHPDYPRITLPLTANVTGRVWVQARTVYFGWVPEGKSKRTALLVRPFDDDVDLGTVTATARQGRVRVDVAPYPRGPKGWWRLNVEVPDDAKVGKIDDVIEVHSAVPGEEITEIRVRGEVLAVGR
ncbi:MAG: DUF1573 domain-containing protein [Planctomycetota bacterium]